MNLTKLFRPRIEDGCPSCVQIHSNTYCNDYAHVQMLIAEMRKDFSHIVIKDEEFKIQKYGGQRVKGITFVEVFLSGVYKAPVGYETISQLEYVL